MTSIELRRCFFPVQNVQSASIVRYIFGLGLCRKNIILKRRVYSKVESLVTISNQAKRLPGRSFSFSWFYDFKYNRLEHLKIYSRFHVYIQIFTSLASDSSNAFDQSDNNLYFIPEMRISRTTFEWCLLLSRDGRLCTNGKPDKQHKTRWWCFEHCRFEGKKHFPLLIMLSVPSLDSPLFACEVIPS